MKAIHPKLMEVVFLANPVCLEGFEDMTKTKEYKDQFGEEVAQKLGKTFFLFVWSQKFLSCQLPLFH